MDDSNFNVLDLSTFDFSTTNRLVNNIQALTNDNAMAFEENIKSVYREKEKVSNAIKQTAENTLNMNLQLQQVVENQNDYIKVLKEQLNIQEKQLAVNENQLNILNNIFASEEDGILVQKEILKLVMQQIDSQHPLWDYISDKGGDIAVSGITAVTPILYIAIKNYLASKGMML